jgi:hypothetical protein
VGLFCSTVVNLIWLRAALGASLIQSHKADPAINAKFLPDAARQTSDWPPLLKGHPSLFVFVPLTQGGIHRVEIGDTSNCHGWKFLKTHSPGVYA